MVLEQPLEQFGDSNVALQPPYTYSKVVIVDRLGRRGCITPLAETVFNGGVPVRLNLQSFPSL